MESLKDLTGKIEEMLISNDAFSEKDPPVLGTSGIPLYYFLNTEKLLADKGEWEKYSDSSSLMIDHCAKIYLETPFQKVIQALEVLMNENFDCQKIDGISGFQRRDWPFSGPLAMRLGLPHYSFYKDGRLEKLSLAKDGTFSVAESPGEMKGLKLLNVSDLMTRGSSAVNGWLPAMRKLGVECAGLMNIVTRLQGGEENLEREGIPVYSLVKIDPGFLHRRAKNPERTIEYLINPEQTVAKYLKENGGSVFLDYFINLTDASSLKRGLLFYRDYANKFMASEQLEFFKQEASRLLGQNIDDASAMFLS